MAVFRFLIGGTVSTPDYEFTRRDYKSGSIGIVSALDVVGSELSIDELTVTLQVNGAEGETPPDLSAVPYGTTCWVMEGSSVFAKFYFKKAVRQGANEYRVTAMSAIGLLDKQPHLGGIYNNVTVPQLLADLIGNRFPYTVEQDLAGETVGGPYLPIGTRRSNLHFLMFAMGISLAKDANGDIVFKYLNNSVQLPLPKSRIFIGESLDYSAPVTAVEVTEHAFYDLSSVEEESLFENDGEAAASELMVQFAGPYFALRATAGLTIVSSGANYAVVSGNGTLFGKPYTHLTRTIRKEITGATGDPNVITTSADTLIGALNAESVALRLAAYYSSRRIANQTIKLDGEKAGDLVQFVDAVNETVSGFISRASISISTFAKAQLKLIENYVPTGQGNYYNRFLIVTGADLVNGTWQVPAALQGKKARIVLFSGAQGGQGGWYGETTGLNKGGQGTRIRNTEVQHYCGGLGVATFGKGGQGGQGGAAAARLLNIDIQSLSASYPVTLGEGGDGGAGGTSVRDLSVGQFNATVTPPEDGELGDDSTFGAYSTAQGSDFAGTYVNIVTGEVIAQSGENGVAGGDGGLGGPSMEYAAFDTVDDFNAWDYSATGRGARGAAVGGNTGGAPTSGVKNSSIDVNNADGYYSTLPRKFLSFSPSGGCGGGGAADGANGGNAVQSGTPTRLYYNTNSMYYGTGLYYTVVGGAGETYNFTYCGIGGDGANAVTIPAQAIYRGGKGGAGGGGCGGASQPMDYILRVTAGNEKQCLGVSVSGKGGNGAQGGKGSDGFFVLYYRD